MIKVLIVDDSAIVRQSLMEVIDRIPGIEVMETANDPIVAAQKMRKAIPDVIILDIEMPRMDGLTFLQKIMTQHPIPVVICSSLAGEGSETALKALELGAIEVIFKPRFGARQYLEESKIIIGDAVKAAASARIGKKKPEITTVTERTVQPKLTADAVLSPNRSKAMVQTTEKVIAVGASTGGTEALRIFLEAMPEDAPGIVIIQHMPENFTRSFADRLNQVCRIGVKEAENNDSIAPGQALIAPGNKHCLLKRSGARYYTEVKDGPLVSRHRPSVDVLFRSAARYGGGNVIGVIMTGMGDDGAKGMLEMKEAGATNFAQDEASCIVFGMPNEAIKLGGVDYVHSLRQLAPKVIQLARG